MILLCAEMTGFGGVIGCTRLRPVVVEPHVASVYFGGENLRCS